MNCLGVKVCGVIPAAPADFHSRLRHQLRDDVMDAAYRILVTQGWPAVRMTAIAAAVGVSRQTLYKEFSSKEEIGRALVMREANRFIDGANQRLSLETDLSAIIETAIRFGFEHGSANQVLVAVIAGSRDGDTLLPFVTTEIGALVAAAADVLAAPIRRHAPGLDPDDVTATTDALTRLIISHLLQPLGDTEQTIRRLIV